MDETSGPPWWSWGLIGLWPDEGHGKDNDSEEYEVGREWGMAYGHPRVYWAMNELDWESY